MFGIPNKIILKEAKMLEGIVVAEFGRIFSAPLAGMFLSDLGARVIKIERKDVSVDFTLVIAGLNSIRLEWYREGPRDTLTGYLSTVVAVTNFIVSK